MTAPLPLGPVEPGLDRAAIERPPIGRGFGLRDGNGIVFVAYDGTVHPSGFLPVPCDDVRSRSRLRIQRSHPLFVWLRRPRSFRGECGACPYVPKAGAMPWEDAA